MIGYNLFDAISLPPNTNNRAWHMAKEKLTIKLEHETDIELYDLTESLSGIAAEFKNFTRKLRDKELIKEIPYLPDNSEICPRLVVREVKSGSIIIDLIAIAQTTLPLHEWPTILQSFATYMELAFKYFLGRGDRPSFMDSALCQNSSKCVSASAKDQGRNIIFNLNIENATINNFNFDTGESRGIQEGAQREIKAIKEPVPGFHDNLVLRLFQARNSKDKTISDRSIIEEISSSPVKTLFHEADKNLILSQQENPFQKIYLVDVQVLISQGKPVLYKVIKIHDCFDA